MLIPQDFAASESGSIDIDQALAGEVIDQSQAAEAAAIGELIGDKSTDQH